MKSRILIAVAVAMIGLGSAYAYEEIKLEGLKCLMNPKADAKQAQASEWKEGQVFFCCGNCKGKFDGMSKDEKSKMAAKSNSQLVATKQYSQKACPLTGGKLNPDTAIEVNGAKVCFCCNDCKGKVEKMADEEKLDSVFGEKAFKTADFAKVKSEK